MGVRLTGKTFVNQNMIKNVTDDVWKDVVERGCLELELNQYGDYLVDIKELFCSIPDEEIVEMIFNRYVEKYMWYRK